MANVVSLPVEIVEIRLTPNKEFPGAANVMAIVQWGTHAHQRVVRFEWSMTGKRFSDLICDIGNQCLFEERLRARREQDRS